MKRLPMLAPAARVGLLVACGCLLTGAALWAGANGPWTARPVHPGNPTLPTLPDLPTLPTLPTLPDRPTVSPAAPTPSGGDPSIALYLLGGVLLLALLLLAASMLRQSSTGDSRPRRKVAPPDEAPPSVPAPDPDRPFDTREAADYVIACWEQVERHAAARGTARRREQTPTEFLAMVQARNPADPAPGAELLALYQRARFDHVALLPDTAVRGRRCADLVLTALAGPAATTGLAVGPAPVPAVPAVLAVLAVPTVPTVPPVSGRLPR